MPVSVRGGGEHDGEDLVAGDLADGEFVPVKGRALRCIADTWGPLIIGPSCWCLYGALDQVHVAFNRVLVF